MSQPSTIRACEIVQYIEYVPHLATPEQVKKIISKLSYIKKWAFIYHTRTDAKPCHIHLMLSFDTPKTFLSIARDFNVQPQYVEKIKSTFANALAYLTHANTPDKEQYETSEVFSNIVDIDKTINKHRKANLDDLFDKIEKGLCRRYNVHKFVNVKDYVNYKNKIDTAFKYYENANREYERKMRVIYIFGASATGKTTLAKKLLKFLDKDFYLTSAGKNALDDYLGQPAIIYDEFRDDQLDHTDFLKLTDPFTASMAGSRYINTALYCDTMIFTSILNPKHIYGFKNEDRKQIFRRLPIIIELKNGGVDISVYNEDLGEHTPVFHKTITIDDIKAISEVIFKEYPL